MFLYPWSHILFASHCRDAEEKPFTSSICHANTVAAVTNDIFTREDQEFLIRNEALPAERIRAIETGGCPHAAIREDISANMGALEELQAAFETQMLFVESGGDNLAGEYRFKLCSV
jgi:urease accessory protein